jgi:hypothetical protein
LISGVIETPCPETPLYLPRPLGEPIPPSQVKSPFLLDLYLSWMSPPDARSRAAAIGQLCGLARQHWYRGSMEVFESTQKQIINRLLSERALQQRVERLLSIRGVGPITALTWALEVSDPHRFSSIGDAVSYCGLTAAFRSSAGKQQRGPISKQRNAWLQTVLIEAAKLAPRWNPQLAALHARQLELGHPNRWGISASP